MQEHLQHVCPGRESAKRTDGPMLHATIVQEGRAGCGGRSEVVRTAEHHLAGLTGSQFWTEHRGR